MKLQLVGIKWYFQASCSLPLKLIFRGTDFVGIFDIIQIETMAVLLSVFFAAMHASFKEWLTRERGLLVMKGVCVFSVARSIAKLQLSRELGIKGDQR